MAHKQHYNDLDDKERRRLFESCVNCAFKMASKFYSLRYHDQEDMQQVALIGLWNAAMKFDPSRGVKFITYANLCIRSSLHHEYLKKKALKDERLFDSQSHLRGSEDDDHLIYPLIKDLLMYEVLGKLTQQDEPMIDKIDFVRAILKAATPKQRQVAVLRYLKQLKYHEVAKELNVSKQCVTQHLQAFAHNALDCYASEYAQG